MNIQTLGNLGEFVGSIVVLITLFYLSMQMKQSIRTDQQKSHSDILSRRQALMLLLTQRDFIELWAKGCSRQQLDAIDAQRFTSFAISFLSHTQDTYIQYKAGLINRDVWEAEQSLMGASFSQPGFLDWWAHGKQFLIPEFASLMDKCKATNLVLYDPETRTWSRPEGGRFGQDAKRQ
jgi:hypothetical protein